ncbi:hypothetical protein M1105_03650 [Limibaculum sp. FT325]|uniref:hypothetical protein n=1 Tax=Thermohalobaculum sediminis TaxID=2939436 RepID=UPI0020BDAA26|nr:hypothetical protein [Limibaculum sediminis]MCL5776095.1 hypothetical protein [Limibaculum sediminis]
MTDFHPSNFTSPVTGGGGVRAAAALPHGRAGRALRLGASGLAIAVAMAAGHGPAHAANECGGAAPGATVTCTPAGNPFADGIQYGNVGLPVADLTVVIESGVVIDTDATAEAGLRLFGSGDTTVDARAGATISTAGTGAEGIWARSYDGAVTIVSGAAVTTTGDSSRGIYGSSFGTTPGADVVITATGPVDTGGDHSNAVQAISRAGFITVDASGDLTTRGYLSYGIRTEGDGGVSITSTGTITTSGRFGDGVLANSFGGTMDITVNDIVATGDGGRGIFARNFGAGAGNTIDVTVTGSVSTATDFASGVQARSYGGAVTMDIADVSTVGAGATAVFASTSPYGTPLAAISITVSGDVSALGAGSTGIRAIGTSSTIVITETGSVSSTQASSILSSGTSVDTLEVHGRLSGATRLNAGDDTVSFFSTADISGLSLVDAGDGVDALALDGLAGALDPTVFANFETITLDNGADLVAAPAGASVLSASQGLFLRNGSGLRLGDLDDILGTVSIDATSRLVARGDSPGTNAITGDLALAGRLDLTDGAADDRTDVSGSLIGQGGTIALDVLFGGGRVAASDLVTFGADVTGTAFIEVNPLLGGAPGGTSAPLITFAGDNLADIRLAQPVEFGGVILDLEQVGNSFTLALVEQGLAGDVAGGVALGAVFAPMLRDLFGDLGARIGTGDALRRPGLDGSAPGLWGRIGGAYHDGEAGSGGRTVELDLSHVVTQLGVDLPRVDLGGGSVVGSVMAQYGRANGDAGQPGVVSASFDATSYGAGLGLTWYAGDGDTYADLTGMVNWHDLGVPGPDGEAVSYTLGAEAGTRVALADNLSLAPLGQVVYFNADIDSLARPTALDPAGRVAFDRAESLEARANLMLEYATSTTSSVQFGGGLAYEFLGTSATRFGFGSEVESDLGGMSGELAARGQVRLAETVTLFGDLRGRKAFQSDGIDSLFGQVGLTIDF